MNDCCDQTLQAEWIEIRKWKPFLHYCHSAWDGLLIDKGDAEFECCTCFPKQHPRIIVDSNVPLDQIKVVNSKGEVIGKIVNIGDK